MTDDRLMRFLLEMRQLGVTDTACLAALELCPRGHFAPEHLAALALQDRALPLPCGQAMTPPSVVGRVLMALAVPKGAKVLEVGAGSGWQTGALAHLAGRVVSLERHRPLVAYARQRLGLLRLDNAHVHVADGALGWPAEAPYDRIVINAAAPQPPAALMAQLAPSGVLLAPVLGAADAPRLKAFSAVGGADEPIADFGPAVFTDLETGVAEDQPAADGL